MLDSAQNADALKVDMKRALRKISLLLANLQSAIEEIESLMSDDYVPSSKERKGRAPREAAEIDAQAPYGRKKDGTPKSKPGRN